MADTMHKYDKSQFETMGSDLVVEASSLGWPVGGMPSSFGVKFDDFNTTIFRHRKSHRDTEGDIREWEYQSDKGLIARVFNT